DRAESLDRRVEDNNVISQRLQLRNSVGWCDRNGNDYFGRILVTRLMNREGHRQAGCQPVIYNDRDASLCGYWRTPSRIQFAPPARHLLLCLTSSFEPFLIERSNFKSVFDDV